MDNRKEIIAENIRFLKDKNGLSISELARRCGMSPPTIASFLKYPKNKNITLDSLYLISDFFGVELWSLLIQNFPFQESKYNKVDKISKNGYLLLSAYEDAPTHVRYSILDAVSYCIQASNKKKSKQIKKSISKT